VVASELERRGLGRVEIDAEATPDPNTHHHMGTTRMHRDPRRGVLDEHARVHGVANLFVAGSSTFPTSGFANPTLTIVALALRLADHLDQRLRR
jgi:choline dehydrogenase-like flavoprotein